MILGLTGSLGSGKSTVAKLLQELGNAVIIDADEIAHQVQKPGGAAYDAMLKAFGPGVFLPDGLLDRKTLASLIFADEKKRQILNSIVHPAVQDEQLRLLHKYRDHSLVVLMVPLLYEVGMESLTDKVAVVTVDEEERYRRLKERSGMTPEEVTSRLAAQMSQAEKIRRADFRIDNSGNLESTRHQVTELLKQLTVAPRPDAAQGRQ